MLPGCNGQFRQMAMPSAAMPLDALPALNDKVGCRGREPKRLRRSWNNRPIPASRSLCVRVWSLLQLAASTLVFVLAAVAAKGWALEPGIGRLLLTLGLYSLGNIIIMHLIQGVGMGVALSLSAVVQLAAVNALAFLAFGEQVNALQGAGIALAIVAVVLITFGPYVGSR
jgi:drug/metabolite transporter (DMT)-like permease